MWLEEGLRKNKIHAMANPITEAIFIKLEYRDEFLLSDNIYLEAVMSLTFTSIYTRSKCGSKVSYYYY